MEESNTVNNTPRELVRLICIAGMLPDPDTHPSGTDLCSSHFSARMSWGVCFPPKIYPAPPHLVRDKMPRGVSLIQYTTQNTKGSLKCKVWGTGTGKGLDCREDVDGEIWAKFAWWRTDSLGMFPPSGSPSPVQDGRLFLNIYIWKGEQEGD